MPDRRGLATQLGRGLRKRCPRCGARDIFKSFYSLKEECPNCAYRFEREEGYWVAAIIINTAVIEAIFFALFIGILIATLPDINWQAMLVAGLVTNGIFPFIFFPYSKTLWMALDLYFHPAR
jgi:uncharacterized protein (DUF983 family)